MLRVFNRRLLPLGLALAGPLGLFTAVQVGAGEAPVIETGVIETGVTQTGATERNAGQSAADEDPPPTPSVKVGPTANELVGTWLGEAEHNEQRGLMALEIVETDEGSLTASLSFPTLDAWDIATVPVKITGTKLELASWTLLWGPEQTLSGSLPRFFVPVHEIPVVFRRHSTLERAPVRPIDAPAVAPVWTHDLGSPVWAGLAVARDLLFVGDDSGRVSAIDTETGEIRWQAATHGAIRARPTVAAETLFVHSDDGHLYAFDPSTGNERWRAPISTTARVPLDAAGSRYNHYASSAVIAGDVAYVGGFDGSVVALDVATGHESWRASAQDTVAGTPAVAGGHVFFGSFDGHVYAVDATSGDEMWRYDSGAAVVSSPLVHAGLVVIGSRSYDLVALDAATGETVWKYYYWFSWVESSATELDGIAYVGSSDGQELAALDIATGRPRWLFDTRGSAWSQPAVTEEAIFIGTVGVADYWADHQGAFFAVDRPTGRPIWQFPQERPDGAGIWGFAASAAIGDSLVFAADLAGRLYAFDRQAFRRQAGN